MDGTETLGQVARRACGTEFRWFTVAGLFTEDEYTKEKGEAALRSLWRVRDEIK
jgi:hypothetical protein